MLRTKESAEMPVIFIIIFRIFIGWEFDELSDSNCIGGKDSINTSAQLIHHQSNIKQFISATQMRNKDQIQQINHSV